LGQSASFVSPHSTVPLLLALGLFIAFRIERNFQDLSKDWSSLSSGPRLALARSSWPLILFGAVLALTVPHAFPILVVLGVFLFVGVLSHFRKSLGSLFGFGGLTAILFVVTAGVFYVVNRIWEWQQSIRTVPFPSDVNVEAADVTALGSFPNIIRQIVTLWWDFWPLGLSNPWLQGEVAILIENFWIFFLAALIITALATLGVGHWLFRVSLGLVLTAPLASNLAFSTLQFAIPERYGMAIVLVGLFGVGNEKFTKFFRLILFFGALATYVISFFYSPLPFGEPVCPPNQFNGYLGCVLP
jgi:hypothetical protein